MGIVTSIIAGAVALGTTAVGQYKANKTAKNAFRKAKGLEGEIEHLENAHGSFWYGYGSFWVNNQH